MTDQSELPIRDRPEKGRFEVEAEGTIAWLEYARGPAVLALIHTEVPSALRGQGIGTRLARHAAELARREGLRLELVCPFQIGWMERHPEFADLLHKATGEAGDDPFWM